MDNNILVQYQGGRYTGCYWEWNFFYIDSDGKFEDIFSSGDYGIRSIEQAKRLFEEAIYEEQIFIHHLDNDKEMEDFAKSSACPSVLMVVEWSNNYNVPGIEVFAICSKCENRIDESSDIILANYKGCGGLEVTANTLLCFQCFIDYKCELCGEYDESTEMHKIRKQQLCKGCLDSVEEYERKENLNEKVFLAHLIGMPDLFGTECREYWID